MVRVVLDTNILVAALMSEGSPPGRLYDAWRGEIYTLVSSEEQLAEFNEVTRRDRFRGRIRPSEAGRMVNEIRALAVMVDELPHVDASPDPNDNYLLAMAMAGRADFLVTGDKRHVLSLNRFGNTAIVSAREAVQRIIEG